MLGYKRKKKYSMKDTFEIKLIESLTRHGGRSFDTTEQIDHSLDGIVLLDGQYNDSISNELLEKLPLHLQRFSYWSKIDLEKYFEVPPLEPVNDIEFPDNPLSNTLRDAEIEQDVKKLSIERKAKIKSLFFNEVKEQKKEDGESDKEEESDNEDEDISKKYGKVK